MKKVLELFETYFVVLVHPFRIHQQFRTQLPMPGHEGHLYPPLTLAESLGLSWIFVIIRGMCKILILNLFLQYFMSVQSENFPILKEIIINSGIPAYSFFLFSAILDLIFFPIIALAMTEFWVWIIKSFTKWLNPDLPKDEIADQITTHALSCNLFSIIPYLGDIIQSAVYFFLLYAGLRANLGASRSFAWVILLTPLLFTLILVNIFILAFFYLLA